MWEDLVIVHELKGWEKIQTDQRKDQNQRSYEPFSLTGFNDRLITFAAADDQVCSLSQGPVDFHINIQIKIS